MCGAPTDRILSKFSALNPRLKKTLHQILTIRMEVMTQMMGTIMIKIVTQGQTRARMDKMDNKQIKKKRISMTPWVYPETMDKNMF